MGEETKDYTASMEECQAAHLPLGWRDRCSALAIPLNKCRRETMFLPWKCEKERHAHEKCEYDDFIRRQKALSKKKLEARQEEE